MYNNVIKVCLIKNTDGTAHVTKKSTYPDPYFIDRLGIDEFNFAVQYCVNKITKDPMYTEASVGMEVCINIDLHTIGLEFQLVRGNK